MFSNLNPWEIICLALLGLFIFGPERLPKVINDGMRMLRGLRAMARNATDDLSRGLGTEVSLEDLHPKTFIKKHLLSEEDQAAIRRPIDEIARDMRSVTSDMTDLGRPAPGPRTGDVAQHDRKREDGSRYDADAT